MAAETSSEPLASTAMSVPFLAEPQPSVHRPQRQQGHVTISSLLPVSPCPPLAFDSRIQSVDLFAVGPHILEGSGRCGWCPCCSGASGPPFDWISLLHAAASSLPPAHANVPSNVSSASPPPAGGPREAQPHGQLADGENDHQRALHIIQSLREGTVPVGGGAELSTLIGNNQLVFGGIKEINGAYRSSWICIYACMILALLLIPLGWVLLFLLTFSSTVRRTLDEYVLYWMSKACSRVNTLLYPCGVALMLLEGSSENATVSATAAAALSDIEMQYPSYPVAFPGGKVWVLRVFMLPREGLPHLRHQRPSTDAAPEEEAAKNTQQQN